MQSHGSRTKKHAWSMRFYSNKLGNILQSFKGVTFQRQQRGVNFEADFLTNVRAQSGGVLVT